MNPFFDWLFTIFIIQDDSARSILLAFACSGLLAIVLRFILCLGYQTQAAVFSFQAKPLSAKPELKTLKNGLLRKIIYEYISLAEKNIMNINTEELTSKQMLRLHFFGWSYPSMIRFIDSFEQGFPFIGLILTVIIPEARYAFGLVSIAAFLILKLGASIFDFKLTAEKLSSSISIYVAREVGQFYGSDINSLMIKLKSELSSAITAQSQSLEKSIDNLANNIGNALQLSINELTSNMNLHLTRLDAPLDRWRTAILDSEAAQRRIHELLQDAETITKSCISQKELDYIEANQQNLEKSMQEFEMSLKTLTKELGDALGSIVEYHTRSSYASLNESIQEPIKQIAACNQHLIMRMDTLFDSLLTQNKEQIQAVLKIKEQMELQLESLQEKLNRNGDSWI